jgi:hypothetical protein
MQEARSPEISVVRIEFVRRRSVAEGFGVFTVTAPESHEPESPNYRGGQRAPASDASGMELFTSGPPVTQADATCPRT